MASLFKPNALYKLLKLQAGEGKAVFLLVGYSLLMGAALGVFYTCTTSLFLNKYDIRYGSRELPLLALAFVVGGGVVYVLGQAVRVLRPRLSFTRLNSYLLVFLLCSVGGLLVAGHLLPGSKWPYFMLLLWQRVFVFVYGLTFWGTAGRLFNFGQAKRLFSFIGTGEVVSSVLSFLSVPVLLRFIAIDQLLWLSLGFLGLCVVLLAYINHQFRTLLTLGAPAPPPRPRRPVAGSATGAPVAGPGAPVADPAAPVAGPGAPVADPAAPIAVPINKAYYSLLYLLALLPVFGLIYVDYMFSLLARVKYPDPQRLAQFLGMFFGICSIIELLVKLFVYQRLMNAYSVRFGIVLLPLTLLLSFTLGTVVGSVYGATAMFFAFVTLSRFFMNPLRRAISEPAFQLLFQPIPSAERTLLQSRIEGGPKALGTLLPGLVLLGLSVIPFGSISAMMVGLSYVFIGVLVFWVLSSFRIQAEYRTVLSEAVARSAAYIHRMGTGEPPAPPAPPARPGPVPAGSTATAGVTRQSLEALARLAASASVADRLCAANALGQSGRFYAYQPVLLLLDDPEPVVREAAIRAAGALRKPELWPRLFRFLSTEEHRAAATAALLAADELLIPFLTKVFNQGDLSRERQADVVDLVNRIGGEAARRFLRASINHPTQQVRDRVFAGLARQHHRATVTERPHLLRQLDEQVALLVWLAATRLDLRKEYTRSAVLMVTQREEARSVVPKIFNLLSVIYGDNRFDVISELILQNNEEIQGFLLELLSTLLPEEVKNNILPLFADGPLAEKVRQCVVNYPQQQLGLEERLHDIINKDYTKLTPLFKAVTIRELLIWHQTDPTAILVANAVLPEPLIAETALYVLRLLNPVRFASVHQALQAQPDSVGARLAGRLAAGLPEEELLVYPFIAQYLAVSN